MFAISAYNQPSYVADPDDSAESGASGRIVGWWKADAIVDPGDGNPVSTWPDSSATGADLTQSGTARPTYRAASSNSTNLPVVEFDGSDDQMDSGVFSELQQQGDYTIIMCISMDDPTAQFETIYSVGGSGSGSDHNISLSGQIDTRKIRHLHQSASQSTTANYPDEPIDDQKTSTGWSLVAIRRTGSSEILWMQNSEIYTKTSSLGAPTGGSLGFMTFGADNSGANFFTGQMAEVILFQEALPIGQIIAYFRYLNNRWFPKLLQLDLFDGKSTGLEDPSTISGLTAHYSPDSEKLTWTGSELRAAEDLEEVDIWRSEVTPDYYLGQDTNSRNPRLRVGFLNGYNVVEFNFEAAIGFPGNDWLTTEDGDRGSVLSASDATTGDMIGGDDFTIFAVLAQRVSGGKPFGFDNNPNPLQVVVSLLQDGSNYYWQWLCQQGSGSISVAAQSPLTQDDVDLDEGEDMPWHILQLRYYQGNAYIKVDEGPEFETQTIEIDATAGKFWLGTGTNFTQNETWAGFMAEWLCYDVHLSRETCANIRAFLRNKYNL